MLATPRTFAVLFAVHMLASAAWAQSLAEGDFADQLPRIPPVEPADALATFTVQPGFRLELAAAEPLVSDPVAMAFDERGRLYVVEMNDYSEQAEDFLGSVRLLEDTDSDGRFDKATVFLDHLSWPTAVGCWDGGVFIAAAPDIFYAKDTDDDGVADEHRRVFTGFNRENVQGLVNMFLWGLDNRLHVSTSTTGALLEVIDRPGEKPLSLRGRNMAFEPRTLAVEPTSGGGQHGMSFDDWGHKFVCSNSHHAQQVMYEDRYLARNPYLSARSPTIDIAADGPQAEVFRTSPVEPWRVIRTQLRVSGVVKGVVEGGGRAAGYFTGATGVTIYRGDAWPEDTKGQLIVGDVGSNLVHRKRLEPNGLEFIARRIDENSELAASSDIWCRPAQFANAPDGTLYIADVYREVIENPKSLPPVIKQHLDLTSGRGRGRIYRLVPEGYKQRPLPRLDEASTDELVALLEHANAWHRETASRLLYERQDPAAAQPLQKLAAESSSPLARMHALCVLDGLGGLLADDVLARLSDEHPEVRRHAVRLAEGFPKKAAIAAKLLEMVDDDSLGVRYQLAFSLGEVQHAGRANALATLLERDGDNPWMQVAVLSSLSEGAGDVLALLVDNQNFRQSAAAAEVLEHVAEQVSLQNRAADIAQALAALDRLPSDAPQLEQAMVRGLTVGMGNSGSRLRAAMQSSAGNRLAAALQSMLAAAGKQATDGQRAVTSRVRAIDTLRYGSFAEVGDLLGTLLDSRQPQEVQAAALRTLSRFDEPQVAPLVLAAWPGMAPRLRESAAGVLFARAERIDALLDAVEAGSFAAADLPPQRVQSLLEHSDEALRARSEKLLGQLKLGQRGEVVEAYRSALQLAGNVEHGREHFRKICASCHRVENAGFEIGPNLVAMKNRGPETILLNLLDPSREVNAEFVGYTVVTTDGRILSGMIANETANSITLKRGENETDTVLRGDIELMQSSGKSIMPEGLEQKLDPQAVADVIAYLMSVE